jgi:LmbE family N-acetylglucosaminyl deacetylase
LFKRIDRELMVYDEAFNFGRELPEARRVLILAAHPDDETLGCGGAIALHKKGGAEIRSLVMTDGSAVRYDGEGDIKEIRRKESFDAGRILGIDEVNFLDIPDMALGRNIDRAVSVVFPFVDDYRPDLVYAPSPLDFHPDHRATFRIAMEILKKGIRAALYEIYAPVRFNLLIDITEVMPLKERAISAYASSLLNQPFHFMRTIKGLNSYRGFLTEAAHRERFYEAFLLMDRRPHMRRLIKWLTYDL